jgi:hypothetical protein
LTTICKDFIKEYLIKYFSVFNCELYKIDDLNLLFEWLNVFDDSEINKILVNEIIEKILTKFQFSFIIKNEIYMNKLNKNLKYMINFNFIKYLEYHYFSSLCYF